MEDFPSAAQSFEHIPNVEEVMLMHDVGGRAAMQPSFKNSFSMAASLKQLNKGEADVIPQASNSS